MTKRWISKPTDWQYEGAWVVPGTIDGALIGATEWAWEGAWEELELGDQLGAVVGATEVASVGEVDIKNDIQNLKNNKCKTYQRRWPDWLQPIRSNWHCFQQYLQIHDMCFYFQTQWTQIESNCEKKVQYVLKWFHSQIYIHFWIPDISVDSKHEQEFHK